MKFSQEDVVEALKDIKIPDNKIEDAVARLEEIADEMKKEREANRAPRLKKKFALLHIKDTASYYVIQTAVSDTLEDVPARLDKSIGDYNQSARKKKVEIHNYADAIEFIPNKILKDNGLNIKTKLPCDIKELEVKKA